MGKRKQGPRGAVTANEVDFFGHCRHCEEYDCPEQKGGRLHVRACPEPECEQWSDLSPSRVARRIGVPVAEWEGNCMAIAEKMVEAGLVPGGHAVYGLWHGELKGWWATRGPAGTTHHGWVSVVDENGEDMVVDPTRWSFEGSKPYIYIGPLDTDRYDEGGNNLRERLESKLGTDRFPALKEGEEVVDLKLPPEAVKVVLALGGEARMSTMGAYWLANRRPTQLGTQAKSIFQALIDAGFAGFIPVDNRTAVLGRRT